MSDTLKSMIAPGQEGLLEEFLSGQGEDPGAGDGPLGQFLQEQEAAEAPAPTEDDGLPEKYKGKSPAEVYRLTMQEAEYRAKQQGQLPAATPEIPEFTRDKSVADYGEALKKHYAEGPAPDWPGRCISSYAASHPWEDWAETWAHYLHIRSTLETATLYRLDISQSPVRVTPFTAEVVRGMPLPPTPPEAVDAFVEWINAWIRLTAVLNETARSMGQPDTYPFVLNGPVVAKMFLVHRVVQGDRIAKTVSPPEALAVPVGDSRGG
jgi:hypothetical protein